jgi:hypothetical protein
MRDYGMVRPQFWTGDTGRKIRGMGRDAQVTALYLMTGPCSNMIGLYYLPLPTLCHEIGIPREGGLTTLRSLSEGGFSEYDEAEEVIFVREMARYQISAELKEGDNRIKGIARELEPYHKSRFYQDFLDKYGECFNLGSAGLAKPLQRGSGSRSTPLRSQEQEQEQEQEQDQDLLNSARAEGLPMGFARFWESVPPQARERSSRKKALAVWTKKKLEPKAAEVLRGLDAWKRSEKWTKKNGEFVNGAHKWLEEEMWIDPPKPASRAPAGKGHHDGNGHEAGQGNFTGARRGVPDVAAPAEP